jgi:DNA-binding HxlR family transcriptional regulator
MPKEESEEFDSIASRPDVVLHPTRLRILHTLSPNRRLTPPQLNTALPDVPPASLYRHLKTLVEAGVVQVIETTTPRGTVEKLYALPEQEIDLQPEEFADARPEDLVRYFTSFIGTLLSQGRAFYGQSDAEKRRGGFYSADALYLTDKEFEYLKDALVGLTELAKRSQPGPGRRRRMFFTAILPQEE